MGSPFSFDEPLAFLCRSGRGSLGGLGFIAVALRIFSAESDRIAGGDTRDTSRGLSNTANLLRTKAGMAELADAADSKSAEVHPSWGFDPPSRHQPNLGFAHK